MQKQARFDHLVTSKCDTRAPHIFRTVRITNFETPEQLNRFCIAHLYGTDVLPAIGNIIELHAEASKVRPSCHFNM